VHFDLFQRIGVNPCSVSVLHLTRFGPHIVRINDDGPLKLEPEKEEQPATPAVADQTAATDAEAPVPAQPGVEGQAVTTETEAAGALTDDTRE
jgi:hypothetical protein